MKKFYLIIVLGLLGINVNGQQLSKNFHKESLGNPLLCMKSLDIEYSSSASSALMLPGKGRIEQRPTGFYGVVNVGGTYAFLKDNNTSLIGAEFIGGYRWSLYSSIGLGLGLYRESENLHSHIPVFIELRNYFTRNRLSPFSTINIGYSIPNGRVSNVGQMQTGVVRGGALVGFSLGIRYLFTKRNGISLFVGYTGKQETIEEHIELNIKEKVSREVPNFLHQLKFGLGINF